MIHITAHAIQRFIERVAKVSVQDARERLSSPAVIAAAKFGAHYVRLGTGQRIVIQDGKVITVLPSEHRRGAMGADSDLRNGR
jgi:hypothetical protein